MGVKISVPVKIRVDKNLPNGPYAEHLTFGYGEGGATSSKWRVHIPPSGCTIENILELLKEEFQNIHMYKLTKIKAKGVEVSPSSNVVELGVETGDYIIFHLKPI
jgi:hypothetical protein